MPNPSFSKENRPFYPVLKIVSFFFFLCEFALSAFAGGGDLSVSAIPKQLLENTKAVVRYRETVFEVQSPGKAVLKVNYAVTILNESGMNNAVLVQFYDKFSHISGIRGTVYNSAGEKVERVERDEIRDVSAIPGHTVYDDFRVIYIEPHYRTLPFTVEYSYDIVYNGILDYPDYYLVNDFNISVEQAGLQVTVPDSLGLRYLEKQIESPCKAKYEKSKVIYTWDFKDVFPVKQEPYSPPVTECIPSILMAPNSFKIKRKEGKAETWQDFGKWIYGLTEGRRELTEETRQKVLELTKGTGDTLEKIQILYTWFQDKTRYASIQIGLGGWQPFEAETVDRLSYGDCKALSNYMQALLTAAGIESFYTLVKAGENAANIVNGFPSNQFNHAIVCVPLNTDTLWLECTNQHIPMGYLGTFTDDRPVLLISENGGVLCHTCAYDENDNLRSRVSHIRLSEDGNGKAEVLTDYNGIYYDDMERIYYSDDTDKKKLIEKRIPAGNFKLENYDLKEHRTRIPCIEEDINLTIQKIGIMAGDVMLFIPNQFSRQDPVPNPMHMRENLLTIYRSVHESDTVYYTLPVNFAISGNPPDVTITSEFGEYRAATSLEDGKLCYTRNLIIHKGTYPPEKYSGFIDFYEKVSNADNKKLALKPTE